MGKRKTKTSTDRSQVLLRIPEDLLAQLDTLIEQYKAEHPLASWSRNNVILASIKAMIEYAKK